MIRSFIGIGLPDHVADRLVALQPGCPGRPLPPENLHLTLAFLDSQPVTALEDLDAELCQVSSVAVGLVLKGLDIFGTAERGAIAVPVDRSPGLVALHDKVTAAVRRAGLRTERRKFRPHVTFCRFSKPPDPAALQRFLDARGGFGPVEFVATRFTLYRSTLKKSGASYDVLAEYPFGDLNPTIPVGY